MTTIPIPAAAALFIIYLINLKIIKHLV